MDPDRFVPKKRYCEVVYADVPAKKQKKKIPYREKCVRCIKWLMRRCPHLDLEYVAAVVYGVNLMMKRLHGNFRKGLMIATLVYLKQYSKKKPIASNSIFYETYLMCAIMAVKFWDAGSISFGHVHQCTQIPVDYLKSFEFSLLSTISLSIPEEDYKRWEQKLNLQTTFKFVSRC